MNPWKPITDPRMLRRLGKLLEELGECSARAARCLIQGLYESDPEKGIQNINLLQQEIADVYAQLDETVVLLGLDEQELRTRRNLKRSYMQEWERLSE